MLFSRKEGKTGIQYIKSMLPTRAGESVSEAKFQTGAPVVTEQTVHALRGAFEALKG